MNAPTNPTETSVRDRVRSIIEGGGDVRGQVASLVGETAEAFQRGGEGLIALARTVLSGAGEALEKGAQAVPPGGTLRQVVDGLGDGLDRFALSARLAVEEARAKGQSFAEEDVKKVRDDLTEVTRMTSQSVGDLFAKARANVGDEAAALRQHAEHVFGRIKPTLQSALDAVRNDPVALGRESLDAGLAATKHAAGSLFAAIGRRLQQAGETLTGGSGTP